MAVLLLFGYNRLLFFCYVVTLFILWGTTSVNCYLLNAYEQAIGQWDLTLIRKEKKELMDSILFPPFITNNTTETRNVRTKDKKKLDCKLCLDKDGSFTLSLKNNNNNDENSSSLNRESTTMNMPLQGKWKLQPNPYCVTDRQYDELCLISNPRVKRAVRRTTQTTAIIEMRCKLWGRYGSRSIRTFMKHGHGRRKGRITHGTILLIRSNNYNNKNNDDDEDEQFFLKGTKQYIPKWRRRIICGKFCGQANTATPHPSIQDNNNNNDENVNDDDDDDDYDDLFENEDPNDY